jgi:hypothetical protein
MMRNVIRVALALALFVAPTVASADGPSGGGCGVQGYPCYSRQLGNQAAHADRSGTITLGGVAQQLMPANAARGGCVLQNLSTGDLWISEIGAATLGEPSFWVPAGSFISCEETGITTGAISIYGPYTGQPFTAREW